MSQYAVGGRVRIDIPDETDLDDEQYHGEHGQITNILEDATGSLTGEKRDSIIYPFVLALQPCSSEIKRENWVNCSQRDQQNCGWRIERCEEGELIFSWKF